MYQNIFFNILAKLTGMSRKMHVLTGELIMRTESITLTLVKCQMPP